MDYIPALTLRQPWLYCITNRMPGVPTKRIENRRWWTKYRGPLVLHAASVVEKDVYEEMIEAGFPLPQALITSAYVAVADLVDVHKPGPRCIENCLHWGQSDSYHWELDAVRKFQQPVYGPGAQQLFRPKVPLPELALAA